MKPDFEIHTNHQDYHEIVPEHLMAHDHFEVFIDNSYIAKNLLLCVIESVTVGNIEGVGTTHVRYLKKSGELFKRIKADYLECVKKIKVENKGGIAENYEWYQRHEFHAVIGKNSDAKLPENIETSWVTKDESLQPKRSDFFKISTAPLEENDIRKYLTSYVHALLENEWFRNIPHYCIIAKPISVQHTYSPSFIPLGNLYLIFGTVRKIEIDDYKRILNGLMLVWFRNYGAQVVSEIERKKEEELLPLVTASQKYSPVFEKATHQRKLTKTKINKISNLTLSDFLTEIFDQPKNKDLIDSLLIKPNHKVFRHLYKILEKSSKIEASAIPEIDDLIEDIRYDAKEYINTSMDTCMTVEGGKEAFLRILSKRWIVLAFIFIGGFDLGLSHKLASHKIGRDASDDSQDKYLWNNLYIKIYPNSKNDIKSNLRLLYSTLAIAEKDFLKSLYNIVIKEKPEYENHQSNFLAGHE